ncbi:MAG: hypothetical protein ACC645_27910 [Pirellulales bacterium]
MNVDQALSPSLLEKVSYLGTLLKSFRQGEAAISKLLDMTLGHKRIERITERIGAERVADSDQETEEFQALTLMKKVAGPPGVRPPKSAAVMGDGSAWIGTIFEKYFKPFGFHPLVDIIHAVTHLYAAAMAGRPNSEGAAAYQQWVRWLWQGELPRVIEALAHRQTLLGLPCDGDGETSPRRIVSNSLTYFQNQQSRMRYPEYRKLGLPITSSHMESAVKELNYRIKGSEKFWREAGGESILQLKSDTLSSSEPLSNFWATRQTNRTGLHDNVGRRKSTAHSAAA